MALVEGVGQEMAQAGVGIEEGPAASVRNLIDSVGKECVGAKTEIYLVTVSRVLIAAQQNAGYQDVPQLSREAVGNAVHDALDNPAVGPGGGRPHDQSHVVENMVVFQEYHEDGSKHFHIAVKLASQQRFSAAKRTLQQRHRLPSHWSGTHTQWWSAVRYGHSGTEKKPAVDKEAWRWTRDGHELDLFEDSQQPFKAEAWRARREKRDREAAAEQRETKLTKIDFYSLVLSKKLTSKKKVVAYASQHGTAAMQQYVANHQKNIKTLLAEAVEWDRAPQQAAEEDVTDWACLCRAAEQPCPCNGASPSPPNFNVAVLGVGNYLHHVQH